MIGGAVGVAARAAIVLPVPADAHPLALPGLTLAVNVIGSFALGLLSGALDDRRPGLRLFAGTGVLGGFTTYSAFAVQTLQVFTDAPVVGVALVALTLAGGVVAAALGLTLGGRRADAA